MNQYDTDLALATFRSGVADPDLFLVHAWRGTEGVSQLYRFEIELASAQDDIDLSALLGSRATLTLRSEEGELMPWHGLITELQQTHRDQTYAYYRAVLEPQLALLRLFKQSRVYVKANNTGGADPDLATIIRATLKQCGLTEEGESVSSHFNIRVPEEDIAATRSNFICQFEESTLHFLLRRLEQAGVYFWFEQGEQRERVVFANHQTQQSLLKKDVYWRPAEALSPESTEIPISYFEHRLAVQPRGVVLRDFSVGQPNLNLTIQAKVSEGLGADDRFDAIGNMEVYGDHYSKQASGERLAALRAEEIACQRNRYLGEAQSIGLGAGMLIELNHHFRADFNQHYFIIHVSHEGKQSLPRQTTEQKEGAFYHAHFTVLPAAVQFRAPRTTSQPRVVGFVNAIIMAEGDGEYAQMNEYGCYQVRFLFAPTSSGEEQANSAWVRMATPYAGSQHGMSFPLLKGTEVLVSFLSGNPDRPVIVAAIPNEHNPSLRNEQNATQPVLRTAGQNALEFEDRKGQQYARLVSPEKNTVLQLGADAAHPEQGGIRLATTAHTGLISSSYIHDVSAIFKQEIGQKGQVDLDPEPRLAFQQIKDKQMAAYLEEQACLPNATAPQQLKALAAKVKSYQSEKSMLDWMIENALSKKEIDDELIKMLVEKKDSLNSKIKDWDELITAIESNKEDEESKKKLKDIFVVKTADGSGKNDGDDADKKDGMVNTFTTGVNNSFSLSLDNSFYCGRKNDVSLSQSFALNMGSEATINLNERLSYNLTSSTDFTAFENKQVNNDYDEISVNRKVKSTNSTMDVIKQEEKSTSRSITVLNGFDVDVGGTYKLRASPKGSVDMQCGLSAMQLSDKDAVIKFNKSTVSMDTNSVTLSAGVNTRLGVSTQGLTMAGPNVTISPDGFLRLG